MGRLVKPNRPRLVGDHPLGPGAGLRHAWAFSEGGGLATRDEVTLATASLVGSPLWATGPYGPHLGFVGGSSQYVNAGAVPWLSGAAAFTLIAIERRVTAGDNLPIGVGASLATTAGISGDTNISCRLGTGGADAYSNVGNTTTAWQHVVMAFDGSQATALNRVANYINGVLQTIVMGSGTFPTVAPTTSASFWIGAMEAVSFYGTGECAGVWLYDRTLSAGEVAEHYADPWGMLETPALRRRLFAGVYVPPVVSAIASDLTPADGATNVDPGSPVGITWTPTDTMNPIDTITIRVNGVDRFIDEVSTGGGGRRAVCVPPLYPSEVNEFESTCTTQDDTANDESWSATPARARSSGSAGIDYFIPPSRSASGAIDYLVPRPGAGAATVDWALLEGNVRTAATQVVEYAPQARADGLLAATNATVDFLATLQAYATLITLAAEIGEGFTNSVPLGASITGTERASLLTGAGISATEKAGFVALGAEVTLETRQTVLLLAAILGGCGRNPVPAGAEIDAWAANLLLEYIVRSLHQQSIEEEP